MDNMSVKVSNAGEEFRSHSAWGGLKLVGIMEICEIVMESIGKQQPIAGLRQVWGGAGGAVRATLCMVPRVDGCRHCCQWTGLLARGAGAVVECQ